MRNILFLSAWCLTTSSLSAAEKGLAKEYLPNINRGLAWLAKSQNPKGFWSAHLSPQKRYPVSMTALSGLAFLMEGSTLQNGKYKKTLQRAADWLISQSQSQGDHRGLIGDAENRRSNPRYMICHGNAMLFLSCVYLIEKDQPRKKKLGVVLSRAAQFARDAQTTKGGWGYVSAADGRDFDEGCATMCVLHGLRLAKRVGIPVAKKTLDAAVGYLKKLTNKEGGITYSLSSTTTSGRPWLTAAAIVTAPRSKDLKKLKRSWYDFCEGKVNFKQQLGFYPYLHFYYGQALYLDGGPAWKVYCKRMIPNVIKEQNANGSWKGTSVGPVYATACYLVVLQQERQAVPLLGR